MKKIALGLLIGASLYSVNALASDGNLVVTGNVTANTCTPAGTAGKDVTVTLPAVGTTALATAGAVAGATPFSISLTNCPAGVAKAQTIFEANANIDTVTGNLKNAGGTASNVQIQLLSDTMKLINLNTNDNSQVVAVSNGKATMSYYARYVAVGGAATAGSVTAIGMYSIAYQ
jgi:major type 1 subunit fimbrin (pilin)